jgi:hypothetical protein
VFLDIFITAIITDINSIYYEELNQYYNTNKIINCILLNYFFADVKTAKKLEIYNPVGEEVILQLENNQQLIIKYNKSLNLYYDKDYKCCPIFISLQFFKLMIIKAMHQSMKWHMCLFYFTSFTKKIISNMNTKDVNYDDEFPTPFYYLICNIIKILLSWLIEYDKVKNKKDILFKHENLEDETSSIIKSIILEFSNVLFLIISTNKISDKFKIYIMKMLIAFIKDTQNIKDYDSILKLLIKAIIDVNYHKTTNYFLKQFKDLYNQIDNSLHLKIKSEFKIDNKIDEISNTTNL